MSDELKLIIESLLFASGRALSVKELASILPDEKKDTLKEAIGSLKDDYDSFNRSFVLKEVAEGYQFRTRSRYASYILSMLKKSPARLSRAALETLAIIAYKQPVMRQEIERIRGVDTGGILRTLMEKGIIRIMGRKKLPGRPLIYGTTSKFLEVFDLKDLQSLPKLKEIEEFVPDEEDGSETGFAHQTEDPAQEIEGEYDSKADLDSNG